MKIWYPKLGDVYEVEQDSTIYYVRFHGYGLGKAHTGNPIRLQYNVYEDKTCKRKLDITIDLDYADFEKVGRVATLNTNKFPFQIDKLLKSLSTKTGQNKGQIFYNDFYGYVHYDEANDRFLLAQYKTQYFNDIKNIRMYAEIDLNSDYVISGRYKRAYFTIHCEDGVVTFIVTGDFD